MAGAIALVHSQVQERGEAVRDDPFPVIVGVITGILLFVAFMLGSKFGESGLKEEAVRIGVAYYTNDASGTVQFKWKEAKP